MYRFAFAALLTSAASVALVACNAINIDLDQEQNNGCCCDSCGCGCGAGGSTTTTTSTTTTSTTTTSTTTTVPPPMCLCPAGYQVTPAGDACFRETQVPPTQNATLYNICPGAESAYYGMFGARVESGGTAPGGMTEVNAYWGDGSIVPPYTGRLNAAGVWACGPEGPDMLPVNEWIGFAVCLDIPQSGEYIIGIAGDNEIEMKMDGNVLYTQTSASLDAFRYWHLLPLHLTSGTHIIELSGLNTWDIAAFGAEISGPFANGSLTTDAAVLDEVAYDSHIIWSTGTLVPAQTFQLGQNSGWSCPGQAALDLCGAQPVCTDIDYLPCNGTGGTGGTGVDPTIKL